jgi:hypothetical protein
MRWAEIRSRGGLRQSGKVSKMVNSPARVQAATLAIRAPQPRCRLTLAHEPLASPLRFKPAPTVTLD